MPHPSGMPVSGVGECLLGDPVRGEGLRGGDGVEVAGIGVLEKHAAGGICRHEVADQSQRGGWGIRFRRLATQQLDRAPQFGHGIAADLFRGAERVVRGIRIPLQHMTRTRDVQEHRGQAMPDEVVHVATDALTFVDDGMLGQFLADQGQLRGDPFQATDDDADHGGEADAEDPHRPHHVGLGSEECDDDRCGQTQCRDRPGEPSPRLPRGGDERQERDEEQARLEIVPDAYDDDRGRRQHRQHGEHDAWPSHPRGEDDNGHGHERVLPESTGSEDNRDGCEQHRQSGHDPPYGPRLPAACCLCAGPRCSAQAATASASRIV